MEKTIARVILTDMLPSVADADVCFSLIEYKKKCNSVFGAVIFLDKR